jgi:colicin import membrane protein
MSACKADADSALGYGLIASTVIHLAVFFLLVWWGRLFPYNVTAKETYYVDIVNVPVADPRGGNPTQKGDSAQIAAPPPPAPASRMTLPQPVKPVAKKSVTPDKTSSQKKAPPTDDEFAKRMAKLERNAEAQQEEAVLDRLRNKVKTNAGGRSGIPAFAGKERGSDYSAYLQSRLKDAFRETISYSTKNPAMIMRLFIDVNGKLIRRTPEQSSGDRAFEMAVLRAIDMASEKFPPPPGKQAFEGVFVFRPQGITSNQGK